MSHHEKPFAQKWAEIRGAISHARVSVALRGQQHRLGVFEDTPVNEIVSGFSNYTSRTHHIDIAPQEPVSSAHELNQFVATVACIPGVKRTDVVIAKEEGNPQGAPLTSARVVFDGVAREQERPFFRIPTTLHVHPSKEAAQQAVARRREQAKKWQHTTHVSGGYSW